MTICTKCRRTVIWDDKAGETCDEQFCRYTVRPRYPSMGDVCSLRHTPAEDGQRGTIAFLVAICVALILAVAWLHGALIVTAVHVAAFAVAFYIIWRIGR